MGDLLCTIVQRQRISHMYPMQASTHVVKIPKLAAHLYRHSIFVEIATGVERWCDGTNIVEGRNDRHVRIYCLDCVIEGCESVVAIPRAMGRMVSTCLRQCIGRQATRAKTRSFKSLIRRGVLLSIGMTYVLVPLLKLSSLPTSMKRSGNGSG